MAETLANTRGGEMDRDMDTDTDRDGDAEGTAFQMCVFRDGRRAVSGQALRASLTGELYALAVTSDPAAYRERVLRALLRAGDLECALADLDHPDTELVSRCTDGLARALVTVPPAPDPAAVSRMLVALAYVAPPAQVMLSRPEGFAYYALHPLDFARATEALRPGPQPVFVVGLRSIGTTLGAVVAAVAQRFAPAERITVRPTGHPYDRQLELTDAERAWVARGVASGAELVVVDEGPGLSGSSLLAVAEALAGAGVPCGRIAILCSHAPDVGALLARDAARRYARFRVQTRVPSQSFPEGSADFLGGGAWRAVVYGDPAEWPASWTSLERLKYRCDGRLFKFEGLGAHGDEVAARARALAEAGLGPALHDTGNGFFSYEWVDGRPLSAAALTPRVLTHLARYCAFRSRAFPAAGGGDLGAMVRANYAAVLGHEVDDDLQLGLRLGLRLPCPRPVIVDGRMMPHEWIGTDGGRLVKVDGVAHGDDHFFPGPTDIAWDLAGIAVEWDLHADARECLLREYRMQSGDDVHERMADYVLAYALFRIAYVKMAAGCLRGSDEEPRLLREYRRYRRLLDRVRAFMGRAAC
jgi:hypothetical protein